jgi:neutral amino acid transport system permease protein
VALAFASAPDVTETATPPPELRAGDRIRTVTIAVLIAIAGVLAAAEGPRALGQATINGLTTGIYLALGAVGLALVYGILKLVNFAHGDMLTLGAYVAFYMNVSLGLHIALAAAAAVVATSLIGVLLEQTLWRPLRAKSAALLQLLLVAIGLAFLIRNAIQLLAGTEARALDVDVITSYRFFGLRVGRAELVAGLIGLALLVATATFLRLSKAGKQMRALADNLDLAETAGIDTQRIVYVTWLIGAGLAGASGVLYASVIGVLTPNLGFFLLLSLFAATVLGGIGNAYGALAGGIALGLVQEWSALIVDPRWKVAVGFVVLIAVLIMRPQGILGRSRVL